MHFAFTTPEFVTELTDGGGLGNYLDKITKELSKLGHSSHVFVCSSNNPKTFQYGNVTVTRVSRNESRKFYRLAYKIAAKSQIFRYHIERLRHQIQASAINEAINRTERTHHFDVIQSADYFATGLHIPPRLNRLRVVRCSWAIDLYKKSDGYKDSDYAIQRELEFQQIRQADAVYCPSQFTAEHYSKLLQRNVDVIRPPATLGVEIAKELPFALPARYLAHYGQLIHRKGFDWLVRSLQIAFERDPSLRIVMIGSAYPQSLLHATSSLQNHRDKFVAFYPLPKPQLMRVVSQAEASLLPSLVDNFPNTVIESLVLGTPVIGTKGASIDELIEDRVNGLLVPLNDEHALAGAILDLWQKKHNFLRPVTVSPTVANELLPHNAAQNLVSYCEKHLKYHSSKTN
jgi:glycosyltransferase involved in cell wall biosynthesis